MPNNKTLSSPRASSRTSPFTYRRGDILPIDKWRCKIVKRLTIGGTDSQLYLACAEDSQQSLVLKIHPNIQPIAQLARRAFAIWSNVRAELTAAGFADILWSDGTFGLAEYVPGKSIADHEDNINGFTIPQIHSIILQMAEKVGKLMELSLVHGDIKPENAMATLDDSTSTPRNLHLIDFDTLKYRNTQNSYIFGSPQFMSAEQFDGFTSSTSDVFALGMSTLYLLSNDRIGLVDMNSVYKFSESRSEIERLRMSGKDFSPHAQTILEKALLHDKNPHITEARQLINFFLAAIRHSYPARPQSGEEMRQILTDTGNIREV